jgi:hypothetical protein
MDYRALLKKYINHVGIAEGTTFLSDFERGSRHDSPKFTDAEWEMLQLIDEEGEGDQPLEIELPDRLKLVNTREVVIHVGPHTHVFYRE